MFSVALRVLCLVLENKSNDILKVIFPDDIIRDILTWAQKHFLGACMINCGNTFRSTRQ